jgi:hypothetical protein
MRLAIKVIVVAVGVALLIAGRPSPPTAAAPYDRSDASQVGVVLTTALTGTDEEQTTAEQDSRDDTPVTGSAAEQAKTAAQAAAPGGDRA